MKPEVMMQTLVLREPNIVSRMNELDLLGGSYRFGRRGT